MIHVTTEIGRLRRVLVHEPGPEVDLMAPEMMEELLFDDILFGERAREEHAVLRRVLQLFEVEVLEARDLLEETLELAEARSWLAETVIPEAGPELRAHLREAPAAEAVRFLVEGLRAEGDAGFRPAVGLYVQPPLPNWCFQRDPQIVIGPAVTFSAMASPARHLEALLARVLFRFHPDLAGTPVILDPLDTAHHGHLFTDPQLPRLEGGDLLLCSPRVLAVGLSERTNRTAVLHLARSLRRWKRERDEEAPDALLAVEIPRRRAYMHLDTLVTLADSDACLAYPPVIVGDGPERARVWEFNLRADEGEAVARDGFLEALRGHGVDLEPIPCGGADPLFQQREQWTDGANALAIAPGVILLYDRNARTADVLSARGFRVVAATDLLLGREEVDLERRERTCVLLPSHELARARGGPHCLSHPLLRDPV